MRFALLLTALMAVCCGMMEATPQLIQRNKDSKTWGPMACSTNDFKHKRFDGEPFDLQAQIDAGTIKIEEDTESKKFHLRIELEEEMKPRYFLGNWSCDDQSWVVVGAPFISRLGKPSDENHLRPSLAVMEEEKVKLRCEAVYFGEDQPKLTWKLLDEETGEELNKTKRWEETEEVLPDEKKHISTLELKDENGVQMSDRANYTCTVKTDSGEDERGILLRVKDKFAALWPFLGICVEVIVLCIGIFIYERRTKARNVEGDEEEEAADAQVVGGDDAKSEEVRKRASVKT